MSKQDIEKIRLFYNETLRQYNLEMDSHDALKDKTNSLLTSSGTVITLLTIAILQIGVTTQFQIEFLIIFIFSLIPYYFLFRVILLTMESYKVEDLKTIDPTDLYNEYIDKDEKTVMIQLISNIGNDLKSNREVTDKQSRNINKALENQRKGLISLFFTIITSTFMIGLIFY